MQSPPEPKAGCGGFRVCWCATLSVGQFAIGACWVALRQFDDGGVSVHEVVALAEQGLSAELGQGVGKTVSIVQSCPVAAFAVLAVADAGQVCVFGVHPNQVDGGSVQPQVQFASARLTVSTFDDDRGL